MPPIDGEIYLFVLGHRAARQVGVEAAEPPAIVA